MRLASDRLNVAATWLGVAGASLGHELVELGLVSGHSKPVEKRFKLVGFVLQALQRLFSIIVEGTASKVWQDDRVIDAYLGVEGA